MRDPAVTTQYEFLVEGDLSERIVAAFPELRALPAPPNGTSLNGPIQDNTQLRGILARFDNLGLTVVEMRRVDT